MLRLRLTLALVVTAAGAGGVMVARAEKRSTDTAAVRSSAETRARDRGAELRAALAFYRDLAGWHLRRGSDEDAVAGVERSLGVAVAIVTVRPGDALSALLADEPQPLLTTRPVAGRTNSAFGVRKNPFRKRARRERHNGVDLSAARGTPVHAAGAGLVVRAERGGGYGRVVYIDHGGGLETRYAHLQKILVEEGDFVPAGGVVGRVGSSGRATGPHLHFEVRRGGRVVAPNRILGALLAPPAAGVEWLGRLVRRDEPAAEKPARKKKSKKARRKRARDRELRSRRPAS
jgi:murein DD-endopeptidase MepM/ murein hydrolase activator NlpD